MPTPTLTPTTSLTLTTTLTYTDTDTDTIELLQKLTHQIESPKKYTIKRRIQVFDPHTGCGSIVFFLKFFVQPLIPLFWTSGDISPEFQNQSRSPPSCIGILRFTSGATPAHLLAASMAVEPVTSTYLWTIIGGLMISIYGATAASQCEPRQMLYLLSILPQGSYLCHKWMFLAQHRK